MFSEAINEDKDFYIIRWKSVEYSCVLYPLHEEIKNNILMKIYSL